MSCDYIGYKDYTIAFYISSGSSLIVLPILMKLDITVERNTASLWESTKKILKMKDVVVFLFIQIIVGTCKRPFLQSFHEILFFHFLGLGFHLMYLSVFINDELKGSSSLYGKTRFASAKEKKLIFYGFLLRYMP